MRQLDLEVARAVARCALGAEPTALVRMPGGASTRIYLRAEAGEGGPSTVLMFVPDERPDEVTGGAVNARWPFLEVRDLLESKGVSVPRVLHESCDEGFVALEDLGDDTLANFLLAEPARRTDIYRQAVADLARAQSALETLPEDSVVATRGFDHALLKWEIDHHSEWAIDARGIAFSDADRATFDTVADRLATRVAAMPRSFVHRDYQSRNLMIRRTAGGPELVWIDFQDALLGPRVYDLVALLGDSYQSFDRDFIEARLDGFAEARGLDAAARAEIGREFDLVTVQRKLKDAGRFVFIDRVKHNPDFLKFVEPTIERVRSALARLRDDEDMRALELALGRTYGW